MERKLVKRARIIPSVGIGLAVILASTLLIHGRHPDSQSFESVETRLLDHARTTSLRLRFYKAAIYFDRRFIDSRLHDLYAAADVGRSVKRANFARREDVDYSGIVINLRQWAATNQVQIIYGSISPQGLIIYVRASDDDLVTNYLSSLTMDELNPFE